MKVNKNLIIIAFIFCLLFLNEAATAQYTLNNGVFSNGTAINTDSSAFNLRSIAGQALIGQASVNSYSVYSGYLYTGGAIITGWFDLLTDIPQTFELYPNFPNPFNPETQLKFSLPQPAKVRIEVYNSLGQHVRTLLNSNKPAGFHNVKFNAVSFSSGMYIYTMQAGQFFKARRMLLIK